MRIRRTPPASTTQCFRLRGRSAFTLLELLTVLALIGLLTALLFPALQAARQASQRADTRAQFARWTMAIEAYRATYGYYPAFHPSRLVNPPGQTTDPATLHLFHDILAARRRDGSALPASTAGTDPQLPEAQNRRRLRFSAFGEQEFSTAGSGAAYLLCTAGGQTEIAVLVDVNLDGVVDVTDVGGILPTVAGLVPPTEDFPPAGIRAGVLFYAPAPGATGEQPAFVYSWK